MREWGREMRELHKATDAVLRNIGINLCSRLLKLFFVDLFGTYHLPPYKMHHFVPFSALLCILHNFSACTQQTWGIFCIWKIQLVKFVEKCLTKGRFS
jgi:hypothetical protein